jgi:hypothetical protein
LRVLVGTETLCRRHALEFTWAECARQFVDQLNRSA